MITRWEWRSEWAQLVLQYCLSARYYETGKTSNLAWNLTKTSQDKALVKMSVNISLVEMYWNAISSHLIYSQIKWCQMSMYLAWEWPIGLWVSTIQLWLSALIIVAVIWGKSSSSSNVQSQTAFFVALAEAIYSASTKDVVTVGHFFED